jgi:hypothetical protein
MAGASSRRATCSSSYCDGWLVRLATSVREQTQQGYALSPTLDRALRNERRSSERWRSCPPERVRVFDAAGSERVGT